MASSGEDHQYCEVLTIINLL